MRLLLVLVSSDEGLRTYFGLRKAGGLVPPGSINRGYYAGKHIAIEAHAYAPKAHPSPHDLARFVRRLSSRADAIIVLYDEVSAGLVTRLDAAAFLVPFGAAEARGNPQNFFQRALGRALRNFGLLSAKFAGLHDRKLLLLPLHNFHADEIAELRRVMSELSVATEFYAELDAVLDNLRQRQRPKPARRRRRTYLVDDRARFFEYGIEQHAQIATAPPHDERCELNGHFRFGLRYDHARHFNVSSQTEHAPLEGEFEDCHGQQTQVWKPTHLNLFPNGYHT